MLITQTITDPKAKEREARLEELGRIIRMPVSVEKFQAIAVYWMNDPMNGAENRRQMAGCALYAKEVRETRANKFGSSLDPNSRLRAYFSPPAGLLQAVEAFFYDGAFTGQEGRGNWRLFRKAFPQFAASEVD